MLTYLIIGLVVGYLIGKNHSKIIPGSNALNQQRAEEKQKYLNQILASFSFDDEITNDRVERMLGVSNTSAERYLDELEKAGKLRQVGRTGRSVTYRRS